MSLEAPGAAATYCHTNKLEWSDIAFEHIQRALVRPTTAENTPVQRTPPEGGKGRPPNSGQFTSREELHAAEEEAFNQLYDPRHPEQLPLMKDLARGVGTSESNYRKLRQKWGSIVPYLIATLGPSGHRIAAALIFLVAPSALDIFADGKLDGLVVFVHLLCRTMLGPYGHA